MRRRPTITALATTLLASLLARSTAFAAEETVALSTSQWVGLATAIAAGIALRRLNTTAEPTEALPAR